MSCWTIVPIRGLATGKSRLATVLSPHERVSLNTWLLDVAIDAVVAVDGTAERCIVASAGEDALELARRRGALGLREAVETGLNNAVGAAREHALTRGAETLLVLAADLPFASGEALARVRAATPVGTVTLVADKSGTGTNGLLLPACAGVSFSFGEDSLARHRDAIIQLGIAVQIWHDSALAFDVDTTSDYLAWRSLGPIAMRQGYIESGSDRSHKRRSDAQDRLQGFR